MIEFLPSALMSGVIENLMAAAIGGAVATGAGISYNVVRNRLFEQRINIAGEYISRFEDNQDGDRVRLYAYARLRQRGRRLVGYSTAFSNQLGKERDWELKGEIFEAGTILGSYVCTTPRQTGMGTFSLEVNGSSLIGHWSGYDSDNHIMNFGRYEFVKIPNVAIRKYRARDRPEISRISAGTLGEGYFESPADRLTQPNSAVLVARERRSGRVFGYAAGRVLNIGELTALYPTLTPNDLPLDIREADDNGELGLVQTVCVAREFQGSGIGYRLIEELEAELAKVGAGSFISPAWKVGPRVNIAGVLTARGYVPFAELPEFWKNECDAGNFQCPVRSECGCHCDVVLYKK